MIGKALGRVTAGGVGGRIGEELGGMVASALGVEATPEAVSDAIKNDPDALVKIRELEVRDSESIRNLKYKLAELEVESDRVEMQDRDSAREAHKDHWMPSVLTFILAAMVTGIVIALIYVPIADGSREILYILVGQVISSFSGAVAYWLGMARASGNIGRSVPARTNKSGSGFLSRAATVAKK